MANTYEIEEQSGVLAKIFRSQTTAKIMDFFLDHREFDYPIAEIAKKTGLSLRTVVVELPRLEAIGLIIKHRKVGKAAMYRLVTDMPAIDLLDKFTFEMAQLKSLSEPQRIPDYQEVIPDPIPAE